MKYKQLGKTDLQVSLICLGTMTFGEQNSESEAHQQLDFAIDHGVNFIDTAELYAVPSSPTNFGKTEQFIGTWLAKRKDRDKIILATKVTGPSTNLKYISNNLGFSKSRMMEAINRSLKQLQTDYVDLYQLHWPERKTNFFGKLGYVHDAEDQWKDNFLEVIQVLDTLVSDGKIRHWGLSNETPWGAMKCLYLARMHGFEAPVSIQNPYNLLNRTFEVGNAEVSIRESLSLLVYSPLAFGLLSGKYHMGIDKPTDRINQFKQLSRYNGKPSYEATARYLSIAKDHNISLAQMSLAYINSRPFVTTNIIGATTMKQLAENIASVDVHLNEEILKSIEAVHAEIPNPAP